MGCKKKNHALYLSLMLASTASSPDSASPFNDTKRHKYNNNDVNNNNNKNTYGKIFDFFAKPKFQTLVQPGPETSRSEQKLRRHGGCFAICDTPPPAKYLA